MSGAWTDSGEVEVALRELLGLLAQTDIFQFEVEHEGLHIRVVRAVSSEAGAARRERSELESSEPTRPPDGLEELLICSPWVGVFHTSLAVGATVTDGSTVGEVEALGMRHPVEAGASGRVDEVFVSDGHVVEYGQPLVRLVGA